MTRIHRREFAKRVAAVAVITPLTWTSHRASVQTPEAPKTEQPKLKLTAKQDEDVKKAIAHRNEQIASMRGRTLPYDLEPAFVFSAWMRPRPPGKPGSAR